MNLNYLSISPLQFTLLWFVGSNLCLRNFAYLLLLLVLVRVYGFLWLCLAEVPFFMCFLRLIFQCFCDARGGEWLVCWCIQLLSYSTYFQNIQQGRLWTLWSTLIASIAGLITIYITWLWIPKDDPESGYVSFNHLGEGDMLYSYHMKSTKTSMTIKSPYSHSSLSKDESRSLLKLGFVKFEILIQTSI